MLGVTSKAIITGDITQTDLGKGEISGLVDAAKVLNTIEGIAFVKLDEKDIVVTPGSGYGEYGEGYIRLSLAIPDDQLDKGIAKLSIGIGKGKKKFDKRASIKAKEWSIRKQKLVKNNTI